MNVGHDFDFWPQPRRQEWNSSMADFLNELAWFVYNPNFLLYFSKGCYGNILCSLSHIINSSLSYFFGNFVLIISYLIYCKFWMKRWEFEQSLISECNSNIVGKETLKNQNKLGMGTTNKYSENHCKSRFLGYLQEYWNCQKPSWLTSSEAKRWKNRALWSWYLRQWRNLWWWEERIKR